MPGLPSIGQVRPLPLPTAAPQLASWTVTGVICSDADPSAAIAILRSGDERRYIRLGNMVDEATRLIGVDRGGVTILRSSDRIRLPLGGVIADPTVKKPELAQPTGAFDPASSAGLASVTGSQPQSKTPAADSVPALPSLVPSAPPAPASAAEQTAPPPGAHPA